MNTPYKVGWVFLGSIVLLYIAIAWGTNSYWFQSQSATYYIDFENVNGLKLSDPVLIRGYEVGKVTQIELKGEFCRVQILLREGFPLPQETECEIQIQELLSGKQLVLFPKGGQPLPAGSILKGNTTFDFSFALSKLGNFFQSLEKQKIDFQMLLGWLQKMDTLFQDPSLFKIPSQVHRTLVQIEELALQVKEAQLVHKMDSLLTELRALSKDLHQTQRRFDALLEASGPTLARVDTSLVALEETLAKGQRLIEQLQETLRPLQQPGTTMHALLYEKEFYQDLQKTLQNVNQTLDFIREKRIRVIAKFWGKE